MLLRLTVSTMTRWHRLRTVVTSDRGDSPVPTVIIWAGIAFIAVAVMVWAADLVRTYEGSTPKGLPTSVQS
ncbi:MAG TPA: hypothetical protein VGJ28_01550 [Micromonosporaceae bacterium]